MAIKRHSARLTPAQLKELLLPSATRWAGESASAPSPAKPQRAPRRGIDMVPITASIRQAIRRVAVSTATPASVSLLFDGTRLLSHNEILSVLPYRRYEVFRYKKAWQDLIAHAITEACLLRDRSVPISWRELFPGPVRLTLFRRASRSLDIDSATAIFKYAIDALIKNGVLPDDNRSVVVSIAEHFSVGPRASGLRIDALPEWVAPPSLVPEVDWFGDPESVSGVSS